MWRQSDTYVVSMNGADHETVDEIHAKVQHGGQPWFAVSPLMHAAGHVDGLRGSSQRAARGSVRPDEVRPARGARDRGAGEGRHDDHGRRRVRRSAGRGTAQRFLRPVVDVRDRHRGSGDQSETPTGAARIAATDHPDQWIRLVGDRERGLRPQSARVRERHVRACARARWSFPRTTAGSCSPASRRSAWSHGPAESRSGYFDDEAATRKTFPEVDGQRVVISGDRGSLASDGTLRLFGRDSLVVNTGGEKVFVEEVEEVLRAHPAVADALVVGRPSERWGEELVAWSQLRDGADVGQPSRFTLIARRSWRGSRRPRSSSSSTRFAASATARRTTAGRKALRSRQESLT